MTHPRVALELTLCVEAEPVAWQRPRAAGYIARDGKPRARIFPGHRRAGTPAAKRERAWRDALAAESHSLCFRGRALDAARLLPIELSLDFAISRPRKHYRTGRYAHLLRDDAPPAWDTSSDRRDLSNLVKLVEDAWQGADGLFEDDRQVVRYVEPFGVRWADLGEPPGLRARVLYLDRLAPAEPTR